MAVPKTAALPLGDTPTDQFVAQILRSMLIYPQVGNCKNYTFPFITLLFTKC